MRSVASCRPGLCLFPDETETGKRWPGGEECLVADADVDKRLQQRVDKVMIDVCYNKWEGVGKICRTSSVIWRYVYSIAGVNYRSVVTGIQYQSRKARIHLPYQNDLVSSYFYDPSIILHRRSQLPI